MSAPSFARGPRNSAPPIPPSDRRDSNSGIRKLPRLERVVAEKQHAQRLEQIQRPSEKIPSLDEVARMKIKDVHAAIASFEINQEEKERLGSAIENASREKSKLQVRLINRLREMGMGPEKLTSCLEDPKSIGWKQRGLEVFRRAIDRMVDGSYQTVEELVTAYKQEDEALKKAQTDFRSLIESHTPGNKKARETERKEVQLEQGRESAFLKSVLEKELSLIDGELTLSRMRKQFAEFTAQDAGLMQQQILDVATRAGEFAAKYPKALQSPEWKQLQDKVVILENLLNADRVNGQRKVEEVCLKSKQVEMTKGSSDPEVLSLRKQVIDLLWSQEALNESVKERADREFTDYVKRELVPVDPVLKSLLDAYELTADIHESERLIRESAVYGRLSVDARALVNRYMLAVRARSQRVALRYGYHMQHAWQKENIGLVREGLVTPTPNRQKQFDEMEVEIHGRARQAYPQGKVAKPGQVLEEGVAYGMSVQEQMARVERGLIQAEQHTNALSADASVEKLQQALDLAREAVTVYATAGMPHEFRELGEEVREEIATLVRRIEVTVERERMQAVRDIQHETENWILIQKTAIDKSFDEKLIPRILDHLRSVGQTGLEEEELRLKSGLNKDVWKEAAWKAIEKKLDQELRSFFSKNFENQYFLLRPGEPPTPAKLGAMELPRLQSVLAQKPTGELITYLAALGQYLSVYGAYLNKIPLTADNKAAFVEVEQELQRANTELGLNAFTFARPAYWEDQRRYIAPAAPEEETTPETLKRDFRKLFSNTYSAIPNTLLEECALVVGWEGVAQLSAADKKILTRLVQYVTHEDKVAILSKDYDRLEKKVLSDLGKLSFGDRLDEAAKKRVALIIDSVYPA